jgi:hypothetical protein
VNGFSNDKLTRIQLMHFGAWNFAVASKCCAMLFPRREGSAVNNETTHISEYIFMRQIFQIIKFFSDGPNLSKV